jgi:hypothetical protein
MARSGSVSLEGDRGAARLSKGARSAIFVIRE